MAQGNPVVNAIVSGARARGLDPYAVLAVASVEGLSGGIGDGGHAYGPFQLNNAGGVITNARPGKYSQSIQQWAQSPAGIAWALDRIAPVAQGLRGQQAVNAIVRRFERPADPNGEVVRALQHYQPGSVPNVPSAAPSGGFQSPAAAPSAVLPVGQGRAGGISPLAAAVVASNNAIIGVPTPDLTALIRQPQAVRPQPLVGANSAPAQQAPLAPKQPRRSGSVIRNLEAFAQPYGLTVTSTTGGKHAKGSYHYRGRAVDFGGDSRRMAALADAALHAGGWSELIYTGPGNPGYSILGGKQVPNSSLPKALYDQHTNHVHLAK